MSKTISFNSKLMQNFTNWKLILILIEGLNSIDGTLPCLASIVLMVHYFVWPQ